MALLILSNWHHSFDNLQLSSADFYKNMEKAIEIQELPNVKLSLENLSESGILSAKRMYLRITRKGLVFDICAAPFGKNFFFSYWFGMESSGFANFLAKIPYVGKFLAQKAQEKTYYQIDTENMFKECIINTLFREMDSMVTAKGVRILTDAQKVETKGNV